MNEWQKYWDKYQELGSYEAVARHFNVQSSTVRRAIKRAANRGEINLTPYINPPGFATSKTTIQADAEGNVIQEWRRINPVAADIEEWVEDLCERAGRSGPKIKQPKLSGGYAGEIPIGDMHMGMYAWDKEAGANWDTERACNMFTKGIYNLTSKMPKSTSHLILADLGDFMHSDNRFGTTEKSGNILDMDSRWVRVVDMGRDAWITAIEDALSRFATVHVVMTPGNHNVHAAHWMARIIAAYFRNCKGFSIDLRPTMHRYHRWENTLLGYSHGHLVKVADLATMMAIACRKDWGECDHRHWRQGHIHHASKHTHKDREESGGVTVESFPILPPKDAYHAERGYSSRRLLQAILHHEKHGEVERHTVHASMLGG